MTYRSVLCDAFILFYGHYTSIYGNFYMLACCLDWLSGNGHAQQASCIASQLRQHANVIQFSYLCCEVLAITPALNEQGMFTLHINGSPAVVVCAVLQGTKSSPAKKETGKGKTAAGKTAAAAKGGKRKAKN